MKKVNLIVAGLFLVAGTAGAQSSKWSFDKSHSNIQFSVSHMVISSTTGQFKDYNGTVTAAKEDFSDAVIDFTINVESINTDDAGRDKHLRSEDFFNAEKFPTISFKSKSMTKIADNNYKVRGEFTMMGVTKTIELLAQYGGTVKDPWGNTKAGFKVMGKIDRTEFGLKYNSVIDSGGMMIGEDVTIACNVELMKQAAPAAVNTGM